MSASGEAAEGRGFALLWWTRRRGVALDVGLALLSASECVVQGISAAGRIGAPPALLAVVGGLLGLTLLVRREWPLLVVLLSIVLMPVQMGGVLAVVGLYSLTVTDAPRRVVGALACMQGVGTIIVTYLVAERDQALQEQPLPVWFAPLTAVFFGIVLVVPPVLLGMYVRARRRLVESLRDRADGLERELVLLAERAEERARWARSQERRRIAREMHDVVAHRVSLMVVHAAALQAVAHKDPDKAARNAALIGDMGRQALTELRTMLGVLRDGTAPGDAPAVPAQAAPAGDDGPARLAGLAASARAGTGGSGSAAGGAAELTERPDEGPDEGPDGGPTLRELPALVDQSRAAGMTVDLTVEGEPRSYAAQVESTAYRVVQEALTNVHKHAAGAPARVRLAHRGDEVAVQVLNDPPGDADGGAAAGTARLPSGGNGLVGMRERVTALGGGFVSGPTETGGFRVSAVIPVREPRDD